MLQFITNQSDRYSIEEEVKMVVEGGCKWVQLRMKDASYDEMKATAEKIIPICKDNGVILVIDDNVELVKALRGQGGHERQRCRLCGIRPVQIYLHKKEALPYPRT